MVGNKDNSNYNSVLVDNPNSIYGVVVTNIILATTKIKSHVITLNS